MRVGVGAVLGVFRVVPHIRSAAHNIQGLVHRMVDGQIESILLDTTITIIISKGVRSALREVLIVPEIGTASIHTLSHSAIGIDGQVQGHQTVATQVVDEELLVVATLLIHCAIPGVPAAARGRELTRDERAVTHVHRDADRFAFATVSSAHHRVGGGESRGYGDGRGCFLRVPDITVGTGGRERLALAVCDDRHTRCGSDGHHRHRLDRQVQGVHLRAAVGILVTVGVGAALSVFRIVPLIRTAIDNGDGFVHRAEDG